MKKITFLIATFALLATSTMWAQQTSIIREVLKKSANDKVAAMQQLIGFDDAQAKQLGELEFRFLLDVQKAEHCCFCNSKKRIEKLARKRDAHLQQILTREQYIKYDAVENDRIRKNTPRAKE